MRLQYDLKLLVSLRRSFKINNSVVGLRCGSIEFLIPNSDIDSDISSESMSGAERISGDVDIEATCLSLVVFSLRV